MPAMNNNGRASWADFDPGVWSDLLANGKSRDFITTESTNHTRRLRRIFLARLLAEYKHAPSQWNTVTGIFSKHAAVTEMIYVQADIDALFARRLSVAG
jgi:hypothetical protein